VRRLIQIIGLQVVDKGRNTRKEHARHAIYPRFLWKLSLKRLNQVWCSDITCIPVRRGFLCLAAIPCPPVVGLQAMRGMD
jgi:putative transposase